MPVMDGLEAASAISELNIETPIVAMTANIMLDDRGLYEMCGLPDYMSKPFTSQELWRCLLKHLKPINISYTDEQEQMQDAQENYEMQRKLRIKFAKENQNKYEEIAEAISSDEIALAHRLVHSLRTNAGMIGKNELEKAAAEIETWLKDGAIPVESEHMILLKTELRAALEGLKPLLDEPEKQVERKPIDSEQILELFEKLEPMLDSRNAECLDLLDEVRSIQGLEDTTQQIENHTFKLAAQTLAELKKEWV